MACAFYISARFGKMDKTGQYLFGKADKISEE
jgi:hypothetical protein